MIEIESVEGADNVLEIGIFQGDICIGASKVEEYFVYLQTCTTLRVFAANSIFYFKIFAAPSFSLSLIFWEPLPQFLAWEL